MKYDIEVLKRKMLVKYPFFGSVVANVNYKENKDILTAGTDGKTIYYNSEFLEGLDTDEQIFIFAHEVCHIAFNHILRSDGKDKILWNTATDAVINQFLKRDGLKMVDGSVDIAEAINYDAEQLYEILLNKNNQTQQQENSEDENQKQQKQDVGHDTHSLWEETIKKYQEKQSKQDKKSKLNKLFNKVQDKNEEKTELEKKQKELEQMGEHDAFNKNREEKKKQLEMLKESISKQALQAGMLTNKDIRTVYDIGRSKPIIDWRYVLRETIQYDVDWSYRNAYIEDGVLTACLEEQPMPETEIVLDTSGSINVALLRNFLRECKNILYYSKLKVGCFDTKFYGFHEIRTEEDIEHMIFQGGGGTDFNAAVNAFTRRVENKIIFTDGEASMPKIAINAIWIVFGGNQINPKGGRVIYITSEQLDKLHSYDMNYVSRGRSR